MLWARLRKYARQYGMELKNMDELFGLEKGSMELMESRETIPSDEVLNRFEAFTGVSAQQLIYGTQCDGTLETVKKVFVMDSVCSINDYDSLADAVGLMKIDRPSRDCYEYVGAVVRDNSMSRARIFENDVVLMRRQAVAEDGDIVAARVGDITLIRRYRQKFDAVWLEAEGEVDGENILYSDDLSSNERKIHICGKVVTVLRSFE